jgi:phosphate transport system permease protein
LILGLSRAVGETMVVLMAAGGTGGSSFTLNPFGPGQTATGAMAALAFGSDQVKGSSAAFASLFFVGLLLFIVTFTLNITSERYVRRARRHG